MAVPAEFRDKSKGTRRSISELAVPGDSEKLDNTALFCEFLYTAGVMEDIPALAVSLEKDFGTVGNMINAPNSQLLACGLIPATVANIKLLREINDRISQCVPENTNDEKDSIATLLAKCTSRFVDESFVYVFKNPRGNVSLVYTANSGENFKADIDTAEIIRNAILNDAAEMYAAHNHIIPSPPSEQDLFAVKRLREIMNAYSVKISDFYLFTPDCFDSGSAFDSNRTFCQSLITQEKTHLIL